MFLIGCEKDPLKVDGDGFELTRGAFIINEGNFLAGNASLSFFDPVTDSVFNRIFYRVNQSPLGDVANSMTINGRRAYIPVNNSGRVYVIDPSTIEYLGKITGLTSPRNLAIIDDSKAYVSDLIDDRLSIVHPSSFEQLDSSRAVSHIDLNGHSSEEIIVSGTTAFVACWSYGDRILVIDTDSDSIRDSVLVGRQPNSMVMDKNGDLWILCDGGYTESPHGQESASIWRMDTETLTANLIMEFANFMDSPSDLTMNPSGDTLYYLNGGIYRCSITDVREDLFIRPDGRLFNGLGIDPGDKTIYVADAVDFIQNGWIYRYTPDRVLLDSFRVGIIPGDFCFMNVSE